MMSLGATTSAPRRSEAPPSFVRQRAFEHSARVLGPRAAAESRARHAAAAPPRHSLGDVAVHDPGTMDRAISATGAGTVNYTYTPEASDRSTKIVFIQVMRELLDGVPVRPSVATPSTAYLDADTTGDFMHVDYLPGERDPYYNGDDASIDVGTQGSAVTGAVAASSDAPNYPDAQFPAGKTTLLWQFRTAAFSAEGPDRGTYYGYVDWTYTKPRGAAAATAIGGTGRDPGRRFKDAVRLWCDNHGFPLPGAGGVLGALIGAGVGAVAGAVLGGLLGGPVGAVLGGLAGAALGGVVGHAFD